MTRDTNKPTIGLALSGSGNRTPFYIGFLEVLSEAKVPIDYISTCSGGCLAAAAFACGTLKELKELARSLDQNALKRYFKKSKNGGLYSLDVVEEDLRNTVTKGLQFEEVRPHMIFGAVDVESGEIVHLCMGDIAKAARISCTIPGIFEPTLWGGKVLVDGGLLTTVPTSILKQSGVDITIGIDMRGTKHIFTNGQLTLKKVFNGLKKMLLIDELEDLVDYLLKIDEGDRMQKKHGMFEILGKSLDIAIRADKQSINEPEPNLLISPSFGFYQRRDYSLNAINKFYEIGRKCALENLSKIQKIING